MDTTVSLRTTTPMKLIDLPHEILSSIYNCYLDSEATPVRWYPVWQVVAIYETTYEAPVAVELAMCQPQ